MSNENTTCSILPRWIFSFHDESNYAYNSIRYNRRFKMYSMYCATVSFINVNVSLMYSNSICIVKGELPYRR